VRTRGRTGGCPSSVLITVQTGVHRCPSFTARAPNKADWRDEPVDYRDVGRIDIGIRNPEADAKSKLVGTLLYRLNQPRSVTLIPELRSDKQLFNFGAWALSLHR